MGFQAVSKAVQEAFAVGAVLVISEMNLLPPAAVDGLLATIPPIPTAGFAIFATVNPPETTQRCSPLSPTVRRRFVLHTIGEYTSSELRQIATAVHGGSRTQTEMVEQIATAHCDIREQMRNRSLMPLPTLRRLLHACKKAVALRTNSMKESSNDGEDEEDGAKLAEEVFEDQYVLQHKSLAEGPLQEKESSNVVVESSAEQDGIDPNVVAQLFSLGARDAKEHDTRTLSTTLLALSSKAFPIEHADQERLRNKLQRDTASSSDVASLLEALRVVWQVMCLRVHHPCLKNVQHTRETEDVGEVPTASEASFGTANLTKQRTLLEMCADVKSSLLAGHSPFDEDLLSNHHHIFTQLRKTLPPTTSRSALIAASQKCTSVLVALLEADIPLRSLIHEEETQRNSVIVARQQCLREWVETFGSMTEKASNEKQQERLEMLAILPEEYVDLFSEERSCREHIYREESRSKRQLDQYDRYIKSIPPPVTQASSDLFSEIKKKLSSLDRTNRNKDDDQEYASASFKGGKKDGTSDDTDGKARKKKKSHAKYTYELRSDRTLFLTTRMYDVFPINQRNVSTRQKPLPEISWHHKDSDIVAEVTIRCPSLSQRVPGPFVDLPLPPGAHPNFRSRYGEHCRVACSGMGYVHVLPDPVPDDLEDYSFTFNVYDGKEYAASAEYDRQIKMHFVLLSNEEGLLKDYMLEIDRTVLRVQSTMEADAASKDNTSVECSVPFTDIASLDELSQVLPVDEALQHIADYLRHTFPIHEGELTKDSTGYAAKAWKNLSEAWDLATEKYKFLAGIVAYGSLSIPHNYKLLLAANIIRYLFRGTVPVLFCCGYRLQRHEKNNARSWLTLYVDCRWHKFDPWDVIDDTLQSPLGRNARALTASDRTLERPFFWEYRMKWQVFDKYEHLILPQLSEQLSHLTVDDVGFTTKFSASHGRVCPSRLARGIPTFFEYTVLSEGSNFKKKKRLVLLGLPRRILPPESGVAPTSIEGQTCEAEVIFFFVEIIHRLLQLEFVVEVWSLTVFGQKVGSTTLTSTRGASNGTSMFAVIQLLQRQRNFSLKHTFSVLEKETCEFFDDAKFTALVQNHMMVPVYRPLWHHIHQQLLPVDVKMIAKKVRSVVVSPTIKAQWKDVECAAGRLTINTSHVSRGGKDSLMKQLSPHYRNVMQSGTVISGIIDVLSNTTRAKRLSDYKSLPELTTQPHEALPKLANEHVVYSGNAAHVGLFLESSRQPIPTMMTIVGATNSPIPVLPFPQLTVLHLCFCSGTTAELGVLFASSPNLRSLSLTRCNISGSSMDNSTTIGVPKSSLALRKNGGTSLSRGKPAEPQLSIAALPQLERLAINMCMFSTAPLSLRSNTLVSLSLSSWSGVTLDLSQLRVLCSLTLNVASGKTWSSLQHIIFPETYAVPRGLIKAVAAACEFLDQRFQVIRKLTCFSSTVEHEIQEELPHLTATGTIQIVNQDTRNPRRPNSMTSTIEGDDALVTPRELYSHLAEELEWWDTKHCEYVAAATKRALLGGEDDGDGFKSIPPPSECSIARTSSNDSF